MKDEGSKIATDRLREMGSRRRRVILAALLSLLALITAAGWLLHEPRPAGEEGADADALARRIEAAIDLSAWQQTGAVSWHFPGRHHLWDRQRQLHRIRYESGREVLMDLTTRTGLAFEEGQQLPAAEALDHVQTAWRHWINDQFWLNPFAGLFAEGVERRLVSTDDGASSLLITFTQGGATPGDAYLVSVDEHGLPVAWRMWVSILPIGGIRASWEDWTTLETGARISATHQIGPVALRLSELAAGTNLNDLLPEPDPFLPLLAE